MSSGEHSTNEVSSVPIEQQQAIEHVFEVWKAVMGHPRAKLVKKRADTIYNRLLEGYTVREIELAIEGCKNSAYYMGENGLGTVYDDIELICREGSRLEGFIDQAARQYSPQTCKNCGSDLDVRDLACESCGEEIAWPSVEDRCEE